ncbi:MAG: flavin reductase domain FMN-binding protein [Candidatus Scalindua rubra]|uniref:Flavin reductase domain FMN-binding protein n=1 Tax=Candidatus Scalindua rubra TaxID=1872076 RepID=A0A1E3X6L2_9BACT|nr:MAG: flavin reductase domain FMN-binding protein [Candidatus Scalindua rubra]
MSKKILEALDGFYRCHIASPTIITVHADGRDNAMSAVWHSTLSFKPPLCGVSISPDRDTHNLILDTKEFALNFLPLKKAELIAQVGGCHWSKVDKFKCFNIETEPPRKIKSPILKDAYAAYECKLFDHHTYGDHEWFVGEVVAVHTEDGLFKDGVLDLQRVKLALYLGSDKYITASSEEVRYLNRKEYGKG